MCFSAVQQTIQALRDFRNMKEHGDVDSCVVVFMSHGRDDTSFYTSDNSYLTVHDVVERFNNRECPILKGKPKIFIFQFCRYVQNSECGSRNTKYFLEEIRSCKGMLQKEVNMRKTK